MDAPKEYIDIIGSVKDRIRTTQYSAMLAVNQELVVLFWDIGRMISEKQQELGWGKAIVENVSNDLRNEFPSSRGFSVSNLWSMAQFYAEYKDDTFLQPLVGEIGWVHNLTIFSKCQSRNQRKFYLLSTKKFGWSKRVLEHQIKNKTYENISLGKLTTTKSQKRNSKIRRCWQLKIITHSIFLNYRNGIQSESSSRL